MAHSGSSDICHGLRDSVHLIVPRSWKPHLWLLQTESIRQRDVPDYLCMPHYSGKYVMTSSHSLTGGGCGIALILVCQVCGDKNC